MNRILTIRDLKIKYEILRSEIHHIVITIITNKVIDI